MSVNTTLNTPEIFHKPLFIKQLAKKVIIYDGAMGTNLFSYDLSIEDYGGAEYEGCPENLNYTKPEIIQEIHRNFYQAGADIVETNTFGASIITLAEYNLQDKCREINMLAAALAREVAAEFTAAEPAKPRMVAGSIGPGTKLPSLNHVGFDELKESYKVQIRALVDALVDVILIETCQDPLQIKACMIACFEAFQDIEAENSELTNEQLAEKYPNAVIYENDTSGRAGLYQRFRVPLQVQVTVEQMGTLLVGSELSSALTTVSAYPIDIFGMNCATGPKEMQEHLQYLSLNSPFQISCLPNAGIPENVCGHAHFPLKAGEFTEYMTKFIDKYQLRVVGGCCGTSYDHIKMLNDAYEASATASKDQARLDSLSETSTLNQDLDKNDVSDEVQNESSHSNFACESTKNNLTSPQSTENKPIYKDSETLMEASAQPMGRRLESNIFNYVSSVYGNLDMDLETKPIIVGERTNANGSKKFRDLLAAENYEEIIDLAKEQLAEGAQILDLCAAFVGRDESRDMQEILKRANTAVNIPIMIDSTESNVIEDSLKLISGKSIINSVNLEDGEERVAEIAKLCNKYGAALVVLTIDEKGMAKSIEDKVSIAKRLYDLLVNKHGMRPYDLIYDTLTFTLGSGDEEFRPAGINTIEAIRELKRALPHVKTILGVSNISFGLDAKLRPALNSVFLFEAVKAGLDMAIVNNKKIIPLHKIDDELKKYCLDLVYDKREFNDQEETTYDPLTKLIGLAENVTAFDNSQKNPYEKLTTEKTLEQRIIDGNKTNIDVDLQLALDKGYKPLEIINGFLMDGMKIVGERFGAGEMQLPFVLQSATTMKAAVAYLEPFMEKLDASSHKGSMVLATVKGDVHDIGKNLVDIILSNNGYKVHNLGIKQPVEEILKAVEAHKPDLVALSGLLVKSTLIMKQNLEVFNDRNIDVPVILGGAALTRKFVEQDCAGLYNGEVYYGVDAFTDLDIMEDLCVHKISAAEVREKYHKVKSADNDDQAYEVVSEQEEEENLRKAIEFTSKLSETKILTPAEVPVAPFYGFKHLGSQDIPLGEIWHYLNLDAMIIGQWRMGKGKMSVEEYAEHRRHVIMPILERLKRETLASNWLQAQAAYGYFYAKVDPENPNKLNIYDEQRENIIETFVFPRQSEKKNLCLTDYFRLSDPEAFNLVGFQIATIGESAANFVQKLYTSDEYSEYLYYYGFATECTEATAEWVHARARRELGFGAEDVAEVPKLLRGGYHGMRFSFGYPACPRLEDQEQLFRLLKADDLGLKLSEEWQIHPEHSTSAIVIHHPEAKYFNI
jgi:5-methyltetrahydrofolate--homocysteine methyltransferase